MEVKISFHRTTAVRASGVHALPQLAMWDFWRDFARARARNLREEIDI
jgi:hypothetical protein